MLEPVSIERLEAILLVRLKSSGHPKARRVIVRRLAAVDPETGLDWTAELDSDGGEADLNALREIVAQVARWWRLADA